MRFSTLTTLSLFVSAALSADSLSPSPGFRSITFNIRYAASASTYERPWSIRGPLVIEQLENATTLATSIGNIPIIGLQETLHQQLRDIKKGLGSEWEHIGTGRDDGKEAGEYVPILYRPSVLKLVSSS